MNTIEDCDGLTYAKYDPFEFKVLVDTGTEDCTRLRLFESWLSIWCQRNCHGLWSVEQNLDRTKDYQLVMRFSDHREAVHFKLASGLLHVRQSNQMLSYMVH